MLTSTSVEYAILLAVSMYCFVKRNALLMPRNTSSTDLSKDYMLDDSMLMYVKVSYSKNCLSPDIHSYHLYNPKVTVIYCLPCFFIVIKDSEIAHLLSMEVKIKFYYQKWNHCRVLFPFCSNDSSIHDLRSNNRLLLYQTLLKQSKTKS